MSSVPVAIQEEWEQHVRKSLSSGQKGGPSVQVLSSIAGRHGLSWEEVRPSMAEIGTRPEVQEAWGAWTVVTDREELRLRLDLLRFVDSLGPDLHDFLTFFFRASDPILYQSAANAIGAHVADHPALREYLESYAHQWSVSLDRPIALTNERSRRRLLIAQAARVARSKEGQEGMPLRLEEPTSYLTHSAADLNAVFVATAALLEASEPPDAWHQFGYHLLEGAVDDLQTFRADPGLLRTRGRVIALLNRAEANRTCSVWWSFLQQILADKEDLEDRSFAERMRHLAQIDEIVRSAVYLDDGLQHELVKRLRAERTGEERLYLLYRWKIWANREHRDAGIDFKSYLREHVDEGGDVLRRLVRAEFEDPTERPVGGLESVGSQRQSVLGEVIRAMGQKSEWLARSSQQRATMAFAALDLSRYQETVPRPLEALFDQYGFPVLREGEDTTRWGMPSRGTAGPTTYRIMLRLSDWESFGAEHFIGTWVIHQITDPYVLLMLLPSRRESERIAVLADALEHQLRLRLTTTPGFDAERFLYETSVRAPHPQFYEHLKRICRHRTYERSDGTPVPVSPIVERLLTESQRLRSLSSAWGTRELWEQPWPGDVRFSAGILHVRRELFEILEEPTLVDGFEKFVDVLDPKTTDPASGSKGLLGLIGGVLRSSTPLIRRGRMREQGRTSREVSEAVLEQVIDLRGALEELHPSTLDHAVAVRDDVVEIHEALEVVENEIVPVIGVVEGQLLQHVLEVLRDRLQAWTDALAAVHSEWQDGLEEEEPLSTLADRLFDRVLEYERGPNRSALLDILASTLIQQARGPLPHSDPDLHSESDAWTREKTLLVWALSSDQMKRLSGSEAERWVQSFTESWVQLTKTAMEEGYESRVQQMVQDDSFRAVRSRPSSSEILETVRDWHLDRYHFPAARRVTRVFRRESGDSLPIGSTTSAFFTNFTRVWLALLVGAILMLDFGGAWTAMAAEGEVMRIAVTFVVGVAGTFGYLFVDLRQKVRRSPGESLWAARLSRLARLFAFLLLCLGVTFVLTTLLWSLLAGTGEVVEGSGAVLHVVVWTGFALFVGVFFGLIAEAT